MARGVPQEEIHRVADALLAAGERPTVERVRQALGRGSPNTIGPMLDAWWAQLAQRLAQRLTLPGLPDPVAEAFAQAWEAALAAGQVHAEAAVAPERAALADALAKAEAAMASDRAARTSLETQLATAKGEADAHHAALVMSDQRNSDLQRRVAAQQAELQALSSRLDATLARHHAVVQQAESERAAAATEREALQAHLRQAEDRAYAEVDRLRQEIKGLKAQATSEAREHAVALRAAEAARRTAESEGQRAQREVATLRGRLDSVLATAPAKASSATPRSRRDSPKATPAPARQAKRQSTARRTS